MRDRTLLLIDDDRAWLKILAGLLGKLSYKVFTATTCAEGIKLAQLHKPACILLDFLLPDANGNVLAYSIKENPALRKTPIIMISGEQAEELRAYHEYKLDGFFLKGSRLELLYAMIESLLRRVSIERGIVRHHDLKLDGVNLQVFRDSKEVAQLSPDQFSLLSLLVEQAPNFVQAETVAKYIFGETADAEKTDAVKMLVYRLRKKLGRKLARRIKSTKKKGWIYLCPQPRSSAPAV